MSLLTRLFSPLGREEFMELATEILRDLGHHEARLDARSMKVSLPSGPLDLADAWTRLRNTPSSQRKWEMRRLMGRALALRPPATWAQARERVFPRVLDRARLSGAVLQARLDGEDVPATTRLPLGSDLLVELALDPEGPAVDDLVLEGWEVGFDEALDEATRNVAALGRLQLKGTGRDALAPIPHLYVGLRADQHESARLLLRGEFREYGALGGLVVAAPHPEILLATGLQDEVGPGLMAERMKEALDREGARYPALLRLADEGWEPFEAPASREAWWPVRALQASWRVRQYEGQRELLERMVSREFERPTVAPCVALDGPSAPRTACTWVEGAPALLPRTDQVRLERTGGPPVTVSWERLNAAAGHRLEPLRDVHPPRFRARTFPTADEIRWM